MLNIDVNIVFVELAISLVYVIRAAILLFFVNRNFPELKGFKKSAPIKETVAKRKDAMIHYLSGLAISGSQTLILSFFVDLNAASVYAVYSIVFSGLQSISASLSTAVTPYLGKEISLEREECARNLFNKIEIGCTLFVSFVFFVATFMIVPFIRLYTAGADINYAYKDFAIIFAFSTVFYILKMPGTSAINAAGHFAETKSRAIIEASICVSIGLVLTILFGQNGCLIGTLVALGWRCFDTVLYANKYILKTRSRNSIKRLIGCLAITGISAVLSIFIDITPINYLQWIGYACITSVIAIVFIALYFALFEIELTKKIITRLKKQKNN